MIDLTPSVSALCLAAVVISAGCSTAPVENATPELAAVGYIPELGKGNVQGTACNTGNHVGTPGTPGGRRDKIMRDALETGNYTRGIERLNSLGGNSEGISVYLAYLETKDVKATAAKTGVTNETVASRLACAGLIL